MHCFMSTAREAGVNAVDDFPAPLAEPLADHVSRTAVFFFELCAHLARLSCPRWRIFVRRFLAGHRGRLRGASILRTTAAFAMHSWRPCRLRGIFSESAKFFSEDALS